MFNLQHHDHCLGLVFTADSLSLRMLLGRDSTNRQRLMRGGRAAFAIGDFERVDGEVFGEGPVTDMGDATQFLSGFVAKYSWLDASTLSGAPRCIQLAPDALTWVRIAPEGVISETTIRRKDATWSIAAARMKVPK